MSSTVLKNHTYLAKYKGNYIGDFYIEGFFLITEHYLKEQKQELSNYFNTSSVYKYRFGSNQEIEYTSLEEILQDYKIVQLTPLERAFYLDQKLDDYAKPGPLFDDIIYDDE